MEMGKRIHILCALAYTAPRAHTESSEEGVGRYGKSGESESFKRS
jgi:hypothetical protein